MEKSRYILAVVKITLLLSIMLLLFYKTKAWLVGLLPYCMILFCMIDLGRLGCKLSTQKGKREKHNNKF